VKRQILRLVAGTAIAGAGLLAFAAPAQAQVSIGNSGFLSGNQVSNVTQIPINVCGNAIAVGGFATASCRGGAYAVNYNSYRIRGGGGGPASWILSRTLS
jgi:hypothetical protein